MAKRVILQPAAAERDLHRAMTKCLSRETIATIVALLQPSANIRGRTDAQRIALREVEAFTESMIELIGIDYYSDLLNDWCL
jgi:hypothetical protein